MPAQYSSSVCPAAQARHSAVKALQQACTSGQPAVFGFSAQYSSSVCSAAQARHPAVRAWQQAFASTQSVCFSALSHSDSQSGSADGHGKVLPKLARGQHWLPAHVTPSDPGHCTSAPTEQDCTSESTCSKAGQPAVSGLSAQYSSSVWSAAQARHSAVAALQQGRTSGQPAVSGFSAQYSSSVWSAAQTRRRRSTVRK